MLLTNNTIVKSRPIPFWNEVKDLSNEDKVLLIAKLSASIVEGNGEAMEERNAESFANSLPQDLMKRVAEYAYAESKAGKSIPHSQVRNLVLEKLGWN